MHTAVEVIFGVVDDVGGHAGKGDGQAVEVERVGVARGQAVEEFGQIGAADDTAALREIFLSGCVATSEQVGVLPFAVEEILRVVVFLVSEEKHPVLLSHDRVHYGRIPADAVEPPDDAAHRSACNEVYGDARPLQHLEHTDVGHALGSAAGQHDAHSLAHGRKAVGHFRRVAHGQRVLSGHLCPGAHRDRKQQKDCHREKLHASHIPFHGHNHLFHFANIGKIIEKRASRSGKVMRRVGRTGGRHEKGP